MSAKKLHIVDGDCTGGAVKLAGFGRDGKILVWRDALYTGPVPSGLTLRQLSRVRSRFWTQGRRHTEFEKRDDVLKGYYRYMEIVLWFGRDCVLCQLSLIQILSWLREHSVPARLLSWVQQHGGELSPQQIPQAYSSRRPVTAIEMRLAERAWKAFRQPSPIGMVGFIKSSVNGSRSFRAALTRMLQEYPAKRSGLSRLEKELLADIHRRGKAKAAIAVGSILVRESVGDTLLLEILRNFVRAPVPLLRFAEPFDGKFENYRFNGSALELTETGRRVLAGRADQVALNGMDRWIGGTHLEGRRVRWRWDRRTQRIVFVR